MTEDLIRFYLNHFLSQIGWDTQYNLNLIIKDEINHLIEAYIDMDKWIISLEYSPEIIETFENFFKKYRLYNFLEDGKLSNPLGFYSYEKKFQFLGYFYNFLAGIAFHEFGHSKECPIDINFFAEIVQACSTALEKNNIFNRKILYYIVNQFTDIIVNSVYGLIPENVFFRNSLSILYLSELALFDNADMSFYYFILINFKLFQFHIPLRDIFDNIIIMRIPQDYVKTLREFLKIFCPDENICENLMLGVPPSEEERWKVINYISNREEWQK
ncbi:MAG: hypothetical protein ACTSVV_15375, partial [Promethearchaeota archaeon]